MDIRFVEGIVMILYCNFSGELELIIFWIMNGFFLDMDSNFSIFFMDDNKYLIIENVSRIDRGEY